MKSFFKIFFASTAALVFFCFFIIVIGVCTAGSSAVTISPKSVLTIDLSKSYPEVGQTNPLLFLQSDKEYDLPSFYEVIQLIEMAANDPSVNAILLQGSNNNNGFANSDELRKALMKFREKSGKPVYGYAAEMSQLSYFVMSAADSVFVNPQGAIEWSGLSTTLLFFKGALDKLEINPQIIYAGKFKSATEPFREKKMSDPNRIQYTELLEDLFNYMVTEVAASRNIDPVLLRKQADEQVVVFPQHAMDIKLIDGLRYEDEVENIFRELLSVSPARKIAYESIAKYAEAKKLSLINSSADKIALIAAEGDIITGKGGYKQIASEDYISLIKKARLNSSVKAVVFRVNSGGGSALASEEIWREITLTRQVKPVIVSMGNYAASGGYYIAANGNTIVADPTTLTGSIGVFAMIPSVQKLMNNKLGITTDGVQTSEKAQPINVFEDLKPFQVELLKTQIDTIYAVFKRRVAEGRNLSVDYVDSIAQGRVWSGIKAKEIGLVDTLGSLNTAIAIAAQQAELRDYGIIHYPDKKSKLEFSNFPMELISSKSKQDILAESLGQEGLQVYESLKSLQSNFKVPLLKPYETFIIR
ncbi:signal peptide peptidase SppA [Gynurincola endophyticus]|uniref:signal peptide peptidase SppA n=1 Tax=Gynurincola endophyticus TaxID=2479004 RepID=UPI000F8D3533|nr:signal peptide peptidase SppA [Gynurincola endophyticus]